MSGYTAIADYELYDPGFAREATPAKKVVLSYLRSFAPKYRTASKVYDPVMRSYVDIEEMAYGEDGWGWTEGDIYLFSKYDLKLNDRFLEKFAE